MATIRDVAAEAGVSVGTVSNYLNKKINVSEETAGRIRKAIHSLNYVVHNSGRELRRKKSYVLGVVFPNISEPYFEKVVSSIKGYMNVHGPKYSIEIALTDGNPQKEKDVLLNYIGRNVSGIILCTCDPDNAELFDLLERSGIPHVFVERCPKNADCNLVFLDNYNSIHNVTKHYLDHGYPDIALVTGPESFDENKFAVAGYRDAFQESGLPVNGSYIFIGEPIRESGFRIGIQMCQLGDTVPQIIITTSYRMAEGIRSAYHINNLDLTDDIKIIATGDEQHDVFYFDREILKTSRSSYEVGEKACQLLLDNIHSPALFETRRLRIQDSIDVNRLILPAHKGIRKAHFKFVDTIRVLILDDKYAVSGISNLLVDFYYKTGIRVEFVKVLPEHAFSFIQDSMRVEDSGIDVLLFDVPWLSYFGEQGYLLCLEELARQKKLDTEYFLPDSLTHYGMHRGKLYALPYMVCTQLLFFRYDLFNNDFVKNSFENQCGFMLEHPMNWRQLNIIAQFFTRQYNPGSPVKYGYSMSLSYPEELICAIMPRLWEYKADLYDENGAVACNSKAMRKAVHGLLESVTFSDPNTLFNKPIDSLHNFMEGDVAMISSYYNYATEITDRTKSKVVDKFSYANIPGKPVLAGWSLGINRRSRKPEAAFEFLKWITGTELSVPHTILGGQSPNMATYQNYDLVTLYPWLTMSLYELNRARIRKPPLNARGEVLNEKEVENVIYSYLRPLMEQAVGGEAAGYQEIGEVLENLQAELLKISK